MAKDQPAYYPGQFLLDTTSYRMLLEFSACDVEKQLPKSVVNWDELLKAIVHHGVTSLVHYQLLQHNDPNYPPPEFQEAVSMRHRFLVNQMAEKYEMIKSIFTRLSELGIDVVVLKGPALAHAYYPQPSLRYFGDLDLFAKTDSRVVLEAGLKELGYKLKPVDVNPMPKLIPSVITHRHTGFVHSQVWLPVEIHWEDLVQDDLVPRGLDGMWRRAVPITIEGVRVKTLAIEDHLLHLCAHAHYHHFDLMFRLTDLLFILRDHGKDFNWEIFLCAVALEEAHMPVYQSFTLLERLFGLSLPGWVMKQVKPDRFRLWWHQRFFKVKVLLPHIDFEQEPFSFKSKPWIRSTFLNLMIMSRRPEKLRYLLRLLFPTPEWLRQRYNLPSGQSLLIIYFLRLILPYKGMESYITSRNLSPSQQIYQRQADIFIEGFDDGALVLKVSDRSIIELNHTGQEVLQRTDGRCSAAEVAARISTAYDYPYPQTLADVLDLYDELTDYGIVEPMEKETITMESAQKPSDQYIQNPDVVLREEDEDGGLLFNPDTNQVKVVNATGLFIWKQLKDLSTLDQIAKALLAGFEDAPGDQVYQDVQAFVDELTQTGFLGTVETDPR